MSDSMSSAEPAAPDAPRGGDQGHPRGLPVLFFAELWERFSFYGMRSLLTLYMTKALRYSDQRAYGVYGAYGSLVYAFPVLGGWLADRLLGFRLAIVLGGLLMAAGHFVMAVPGELALYVAMALLCLGNGFFKPNISSLLGQLYVAGDARRDAGFTIFYMGINIGALAAPLLCGTIGQRVDWHWGFGLAGFGMVLGLLWFLSGRARLQGHGQPPDVARLMRKGFGKLSALQWTLIATGLSIGPVALALRDNQTIGYLLYALGVVVYGGLIVRALRQPAVVRGRLLAAIVLMACSMVFWALFEQAGSSLTLFTERNVDREVIPHLWGLRDWIGADIPASALLAINPLYIMFLALPFARLWTSLKQRQHDPSIPTKFSLGLIQLGLGFLVVVYLAAPRASAGGLTGIGWLLLMYLLHTTGELCLSPVGLSAMTKLAPPDSSGLVMGAWFLATSYSHHFGGAIAKLTALKPGAGGGSGVASLEVYTDVFAKLGWLAVVVGLGTAVAARPLKRLMHGVR